MQLDIEKTKIDVSEEVAEGWGDAGYTMPNCTYFLASLDGTSVEGHAIHLYREATSPDAAIRSLFEAMTEAGVTL